MSAPAGRTVSGAGAFSSVDELRAAYKLVTPERCIEIAQQLGTEPEKAWASLRLFESEVLPHIEVSASSWVDA